MAILVGKNKFCSKMFAGDRKKQGEKRVQFFFPIL